MIERKGGHDRYLAIVVTPARDAGYGRSGAVGHHRKARFERFIGRRLELEPGGIASTGHSAYRCAEAHVDAGIAQRGVEHLRKRAVRHDIAKCRQRLFRRRQLHGAESGRLRDVDCKDRRHRTGRRRERRPDAQPFEYQPRAVRQRERAVDAGCFAARPRIDDDDVEIRAGKCERKRCSDGSGAGDGDVMDHLPTAASISATDFGAPAVMLSTPSAVTSTSSSMRTPMFQKASGTFAAGRMYAPGSTVSTIPGTSRIDSPRTW